MSLLWKYRSIANLEFLEALVLRDEVYFSTAPELNDPSETRFRLHPDFPISLAKQLASYREVSSPTEFVDRIAEVLEGGPLEPLATILRKSLFEHFRLLCLSKTASNPLMWAHYAGNHSGICVGVDLGRLLAAIPVAVHGAVRYQDNPFSMNVTVEQLGDTDALLRGLAGALFTKDRRWAYEQESRLAIFDTPAVQSAPGAVRSVVIGLRSSAETRELVTKWRERRPHLEVFDVTQGSSFEFTLSRRD